MSKTTKQAANTPPQATPSPLQRWHDRWSKALDVLEELGGHLAAPPAAGDDPQERLTLLLEIFNRLHVPVNDLDPAGSTGERWASKVAGTHARENVKDWLREAVRALEQGIATALRAGASNDALIATRDFAEGLRNIDSGGRLADAGMVPVEFAVGLIGSLPAAHRLRSVLPAEDLYLFSGREPALVLGLADRNGTPRPWYRLDDAVRLTRHHRGQQVQREREKTEAERLEARKREIQFWASPLGQRELELRELEKLRAAGKVPNEFTPAPAVRPGSW